MIPVILCWIVYLFFFVRFIFYGLRINNSFLLTLAVLGALFTGSPNPANAKSRRPPPRQLPAWPRTGLSRPLPIPVPPLSGWPA